MARAGRWVLGGCLAVVGLLAVMVVGVLLMLGRGGGVRDREVELAVAGEARTFLVHAPAGADLARPAALVFAFHGGLSRARSMVGLTGLDRLADREGFFVVYPQGLARHWNDGRSRSLRLPDDVGFVRAVLAWMEREHRVDRRRVYATGVSNGGFLSQRLACEMAADIAAVASIAGPMAAPVLASCRPARPVPVLLFHGTDDPLVPYAGGRVRGPHGGAGASVAATAGFWARTDGCTGAPVTADLPDAQPADGTHVRRTLWAPCAQGAEVAVYTVENGGHTWPGGPQYLPAFLVGKASRAIDATAIAWDFFRRHPQPAGGGS
jgi:polyhydroxybutyrate depolymerase